MPTCSDGLGPFLGIFLTQRHWQAEDIGPLMSVGGIAGLLATLPAGFITDSSRHKRLLLAGVCLAITLTTLLLWFSQKTSVVALSQVASGICAAFVGPLIAGITLGLARQRGFSAQMGKNEAFNHAGNFFTALMAGAIAWYWGIGGTFILMACTHAALPWSPCWRSAAAISTMMPPAASKRASTPSLPGFAILFRHTPLLDRRRNPDAVPSRQCRTVADAEHADRRRAGTPQSRTVCRRHGDYFAGGDDPGGHPVAGSIDKYGYWRCILLALLIMPIRAALAASSDAPAMMVPVQILDGLAAGILGWRCPALSSRCCAAAGTLTLDRAW